MDYETPDGSQFSLREVLKDVDGGMMFDYTTISAYVDGKAYTGKILEYPEEVDEADILSRLEPVPSECIHPQFPTGYTMAPELDSEKHYLKAPSFTYEDCEPGKTFVADCVLNEAGVYELLKERPHPNLASYYGCVTKDGRITHLCLQRYQCGLREYTQRSISGSKVDEIRLDIQNGIEHLHSLGLAHNDINVDNVCIDANGSAVIVDFDSCLPSGEKLLKGVHSGDITSSTPPLSRMENDLQGLSDISKLLWSLNIPAEEGEQIST